MGLKTSTGLRGQLLDTGSLKTVMDGGHINIYTGTAPLTADDAIGSQSSNTLLCTITVDGLGGGLNFEASAVNGTLPKSSAEAWKGTNAASGQASFYRHVASGDDGTASATQPRIQGSIGLVGAELNISALSLSSGAEQNIDSYSITLPTF